MSSAQVFDRQVGLYADTLAARNRQHPDLAAIGAIRTALGFSELSPDQSLSSTRQIDRGQTVMVWPQGEDTESTEGSLPWLVLERDEGALTLAPVLRNGRQEPEIIWRRGQTVTARFWREGDTEYSFEAKVLGKARSAHAIDIRHASVKRMQYRDFFRIDVDFPADFLVLPVDLDNGAGTSTIHRDAAIGLLDQTTDTSIRVAPSDSVAGIDSGTVSDDPNHRPDDRPSDQPDRLATATRVSGRIVNLSAGGVAIEVPTGGPTAGQETAWVIDPAFEGPFPLAAITCLPVSTEPASGGGDRPLRRIKMTFEDLPTPVEKEIVRGVYEHQLQAAGGRGTPSPDAPSVVEDDDLPTS